LTHPIEVNLSERSYSIFIQDGLLDKCAPHIHRAVPAKKIAILTHRKVFEWYGGSLCRNLKNAGIAAYPLFVPEGEIHKNEKTLMFILRKLASFGFQRDAGLLALGGGVLGDMGGLAASLYMRGIDFIQCPTTLLAQVDASIGGKTAIDFSGIKNLIGAFYQPKLVLIDPTTLKTLNERQFRTGLAEVVKYGVIADGKLFRSLEKNLGSVLSRQDGVLNRLIHRSCSIKAKIVSRDERESGSRARLNYGHTLGHALEAYYGYDRLSHGEAIAYGMWFASSLSVRLGLCTKEVLIRQVRLLRRIGLFKKISGFNVATVYEKMLLDKKGKEGSIQFVLTRKIGLVNIQKNIPRQIILSALTQLLSQMKRPSKLDV
jgi:3-dehydroquinate synthase